MDVSTGYCYDLTTVVEVLRYDGNRATISEEEVCTEETATIIVNDISVVSLALTPGNLRAFACGHLICEGWIRSLDEIASISIEEMNINVKIPGMNIDEKQIPSEIRSSGCPGRRGTWVEIDQIIPEGFSVTGSVVFDAGKKVNELAVLWQKTGGTHCSVIMDDSGQVIASAEDMGRHSSVDKAVGMALLKGVDLRRTLLACSGRMPADMVAKGIRAGIPIIVSHNAPFIHGIELARRVNATLAGFVRPPRMNIYSGSHRILLDSG